ELAPLRIDHTQLKRDAQKRSHCFDPVILVGFGNVLRRALQRIERATIVFAGFINRLHDALITADECLDVHFGYEVNGGDRVVAGGVRAEQSSFSFEPPPKLRVGKCVQHSHHRHWNRAFTNKLDLAFEDVFGIVVEADDETRHHFHAAALDSANRVEQVAAILCLLSFFQTLFNWSFNAEKHTAE